MFKYFLKRIFASLLTLLVLVSLIFFLLRLAPGFPFDSDKPWPPAVKENIQRKYGLDKPVVVQFGLWMKDLLQGDLRDSFYYTDEPVSNIIFPALKESAKIGGIALFFSFLIGIFLGALSALKNHSFWDSLVSLLSISGISFPVYLIASLLIVVFSLKLKWVPPALLEDPESYILPILTLSLKPIGMIARMTRTTLLDALSQDYIRTAKGKGCSSFSIIYKHALKNSINPVLSLIGPLTANLLTGSFAVEMIFQLPGIGRHFVNSVVNRDYPVVIGTSLVFGAILILCNLLVDLLYGAFDPRIRSYT